ncbi:MAG: hypothetical protein LIO54_08325 [Oscillospiraceae bacterium]|nr:hypothetical protein [Oscillospiraceae bacterium]
MIWKVLYFQQRAKTEKIKVRLKKQEEETRRQAGKAESFYNSYMAELDRVQDFKESLTVATCKHCGEEIVMITRRGRLNYCPKCGFPIMQTISIAERRCYM